MKKLVPYTICLALVTYAHAATVDTGYRPSTDGYRFQNFGGNILVTIPILNISVPSAGNCYGFSARSADHFHYAIPIPANTTRTSAQEADLISRQWDWSTELVFAAQQMGSAILGINTMAGDYQWLKTKLEAGEPWPIFVSGEPTMYAIGGPYPVIHVLLAYKIVENYQGISGRHAIFLYDSNYPQKDDVIALVSPANSDFQLNSYWDFYWFTTMRSYTPSLPNDEFVNAIVVAGSTGQTLGANIDCSKEIGEPSHAGNAGGKSAWWTWTAPASGDVSIDTFGSTFDTLLGIYSGTAVGSLTSIASNDDAAGGRQSRAAFSAVSGTTYRIAVDGYNGASGNITLSWSLTVPRPPNDAFTNALPIVGAAGQTNGGNGEATKEAGEPNHAGNAGGKSVWWMWSAPSDGYVNIDTLGSTFDTLLAVYTGSLVNSLNQVASNDDAPGVTQSRVTLTVVAGTTYRIAVDGWNAASGNITLNWAHKPAIVMQVPEVSSDGRMSVRWTSSASETYSLFSTTNLLQGFSLLESNIEATPPMNTYTDMLDGVSRKFWKISVEE